MTCRARITTRMMIGAPRAEGSSQNARTGSRSHSGRCGPLFTENAVIEALRQSTGGRLDLPTGTIYPALGRLEQAGLITGSWSVVAGRQRREYRLTAAGKRALSGKRADWRDFAAMVSAALEGKPWPSPA